MPFRRTKTEPTPLDGVDLVLADLDGVVYKGPHAIPHAVESLERAADGRRVGYLTNNASRTAASVAGHLAELGLSVTADDVVTSPQAAVVLLADLVPAGSRILVVGGDGLVDEVEKAGFAVTRSALDEPAAVIQGFAPHVGWTDLAEASFALAGGDDGIPWVATNTDWSIPVERGIAPGNGTLVSAVHSAVGRLPVVAGKPELAIFEAATRRFGASSPLFIGDRLDTDILGANRAGMRSALVLTGIDQAKQVLAADASMRPTIILGDLRELHEPYPATVESSSRRSGVRRFTVRDAVVELEGREVRLAERGDAEVDVLRAGAAAIWGSGAAIYALEVDEHLYA
ncbi:HAD-IIA family hydrolase [Homoserinibacter sp. YIM 151385]|uniref:HAD-IIA family hydrolase n=1 Tax=Homoserinibacter sp. YIM 151385 TaxID=2985506 RepID=UPI0022F08826|nr:HAD-IIA family hydrolase [Homoserinibacter sp. YIM 151385]WBU38857.1 HAD-IIA family hydrolase [Homoserinibacter sp. YIM 151385]